MHRSPTRPAVGPCSGSAGDMLTSNGTTGPSQVELGTPPPGRGRARGRTRRGCAPTRPAGRGRAAPRCGRRATTPCSSTAGSEDSGRTTRPEWSSGRNRLWRATQSASRSRSSSVAAVRSHSMPKAPNSAVAARKSRRQACARWCARSATTTCAPRYSGATSWVVHRWICWRASGVGHVGGPDPLRPARARRGRCGRRRRRTTPRRRRGARRAARPAGRRTPASARAPPARRRARPVPASSRSRLWSHFT